MVVQRSSRYTGGISWFLGGGEERIDGRDSFGNPAERALIGRTEGKLRDGISCAGCPMQLGGSLLPRNE